MKDIKQIDEGFCKGLKVVFTDIDDTITDEGLILDISYQAIWDLHRNGIDVVPVTGRPAGWCDHIARMWPVKGVVGENGAFYYSYDRIDRRMNRKILLTEREIEDGKRRLKSIEKRVLSEVKGCAISADQPFRLVDLAIDYCEDVKPLSEEEVEKICRIVEEEGAKYKVSSIHVNCWFGNFDKLTGIKAFYRDFYGGDLDDELDRITFIGDSLNDEPMFEAFDTTIAVANIKRFAKKLKYYPTYITENSSARGFREAISTIIGKRKRG